MILQTRIPLPRVAAILSAKYGSSPPYRKIYMGACDGKFPVHIENGRISVEETNLTKVAEAFGLIAAESVAA